MSAWEHVGFVIAVVMLQCFNVMSLLLVGVWVAKYLGGFAWDGSGKQFNYHPLFMLLSMVILSSQAIIMYRVMTKQNKLFVKLLHMAIQVIAFIFAVVGLQCAFDFHNHLKIANMYSSHSWLGIVTMVLFTCQFVFGVLGFLYPKFPDSLRAAYLKIHVFFGTSVFLLSVATCLTGISEKAFFSIPNYSELPPDAILINVLTLVLIIITGLTFFIVTNPSYKRPNDNAEEEPILLNEVGSK